MSAEPRAAVLLVGAQAARFAEFLEHAGLAVECAMPQADGGTDAAALRALDAALAALAARPEIAADRIAAIGAGPDAALTYLFACRATGLAAVVVRGGPIVRAELSAARPIQPLEMTLNLSAAVLGLFDEGDPAAPPEHVALLREALSQGCKHFEIAELSGTSGATETAVRAAMLEFLREWLELPG